MLKNLKKKVAITFAFSTILSSAVFAQNINVVVDGSLVNFLNQQPVVVDGRTLIPLRGVFEKLGYSVVWDANTKTATLSNGTYNVVMQAGNKTFEVNSKTFNLDVPAQIINSSMMIPLRAVGEGTGVSVNWDANTKTAEITSSDKLNASDITLEDAVNIKEYAEKYIELVEPLKTVTNEYANINKDDPKEVEKAMKEVKEKLTNMRSELNNITPPEVCSTLHNLTLEFIDKTVEFFDYAIVISNGEVKDSEAVQQEKAMSYLGDIMEITSKLTAESNKFEELGNLFK